MNHSHLSRSLLWKDYRQVFPFWLTALLTGIVVLTLLPLGPPELQLGSTLIGLCGLLGLVVGISLFTIEHDQKTESFLRWLPSAAGFANRLKLTLGLIAVTAGWLVFVGVFKWAVLRSYFDATTSTYVEQNQWIELALATSMWCFLATAIAARLFASSLESAVAALAGVIGIMFAINLMGQSWGLSTSLPFAVKDPRDFMYSRGLLWLGFIVLTGLTGYLLTRPAIVTTPAWSPIVRERWWPGRIGSFRKWQFNGFRSLVWLSLRQTMLWILGLYLVVILYWFVSLIAEPFQIRWYNRETMLGLAFANFVGLIVLTSLASAAVFWPDQRQGSFAFAWQHRIAPGQFWTARMLCWTLGLAALAVWALSIHPMLLSEQFKQIYYQTNIAQDNGMASFRTLNAIDNLMTEFYMRRLYLLPMLLLGILATGQFTSLLFANGLLALLVQFLLATLTCSWFCLVVDRNEPIVLFAVPGTIAFFGGGFWLCQRRLAGRTIGMPATITCLMITLVLLGQYLAFTNHRQYEFTQHNFAAEFLRTTPNGDELWKYPPNEKLAYEIGTAIMSRNVKELDSTVTQSLRTADDPLQVLSKDGGYFLIATEFDKLSHWREQSPEREAVQQLFAKSPLTPSLNDRTAAQWRTWLHYHGLDLAVTAERALAANDLTAAWSSLRALIHLEASGSGQQLSRYLAWLLLRWSEHPDQTPELLTQAMRSMAFLGQRSVAPYLTYRSIEEELKKFHEEHGLYVWLVPSLAEQVRQMHLSLRDIGTIHRHSSYRTKRFNDNVVRTHLAAFSSNFAPLGLMDRAKFRTTTISGFEPMPVPHTPDKLQPVSYWDVLSDARDSAYQSMIESETLVARYNSSTYHYLYVRFALDRFFVVNQRYPTSLDDSRAENHIRISDREFPFLTLYHYTDERWNDPELLRFPASSWLFGLDYRPAKELGQTYWPQSQALIPVNRQLATPGWSGSRSWITPESSKLNRQAKE